VEFAMPDKTQEELIEWLEGDEARSRPYRANRLRELLTIFGGSESNILFLGGSSSYQAYTELRLAFIHGLYFATVVLSLACIEQELAGSVHAQGSDQAATVNLETLLSDAFQSGQIDQTLYDSVNRLRSVRNAYAHFRPPTHPTSAVQRTVRESIPLDELSEHDAIGALHVLASFINRRSRA
jgi:hypothetical protein